MEDQRPIIPEADDKDEPAAKRRNRAGDFFAAYLARREANQSPERAEDDDDDDESLTPSEKRWKKLFRPLKSLLQRPERPGKPSAPDAAPANPELSAIPRGAAEAAPDPSIEGLAVSNEGLFTDNPDASAVAPPAAGEAQPAASSARQSAETQPPARETGSSSPAETAAAAKMPEALDRTEPADSTGSADRAEAPNGVETPVPPNTLASTRTAERPLQAVERTIIERDGPATALVGLEYLARRRAVKKLAKRSAANVAKQTNPLKAATKQQQATNQQVDTSARRQAVELGAVNQRVEDTAERVRHLEQATAASTGLEAGHRLTEVRDRPAMADRLDAAYRPQSVEQSIATADKPVPLTEIYRRAVAPPAIETNRVAGQNERLTGNIERLTEKVEAMSVPKPESIIEQVAYAAEINAPIERSYERRQEVKDDPAFAAQSAAGSVSRQTNTVLQQTATSLDDSLQRTQKINQSLVTQLRNMPPQYRQATASGFVAAVALLAVTLIITLL